MPTGIGSPRKVKPASRASTHQGRTANVSRIADAFSVEHLRQHLSLLS